MFKKKPSDLTTPDAVAKSQKIYDRITSGDCKDAVAELNKVHGHDRTPKRG